MNDAANRDTPHDEAPQARVYLARWSPWIWIVPILAIFFVGFLVIRYGFFGGGDVTVRFVEARGLDRYSPVRFRGAKVGTVQKITIDEDMRHVLVRITMDASMSHALREQTRFWIVEPGLEGGGLGGLLSGTYVAIAPGGGEETREFLGQEHAPILAAPEDGTKFILETNSGGTVAAGAPIHFEGLRVGRILGTEYDAARAVTLVHAFVVRRFAGHVRQSTRFWRAGGLSMSLSGGKVSMGDASLSSLLNAPIAFYTPDVLAGPPAAEMTRFRLHDSRAAAEAAADGPHLTYLTYFPGPIHGLAPGAPVRMKGVDVGHVRDVRLRYVPQNASLETPVVLAIDPRRLELTVDAATTREDLRRRMNDVLASLVHKGLRATLSTSLVLPGASGVGLDVVAAPGTARLGLAGDPPVIPAAAAGSGLEGAMAAIGDVATTIRNLPIREIAGHLRSASQRLDTLVHDPVLDRSLRRLDASLADLERVADTAGEHAGPIARSLRNAAASAETTAKAVESTVVSARQDVEPIVSSLRNAAASAEAAAKRAEELMGTSQRQNYDLGELVRELTRAAEAVRTLANYLSETPDALLRGRRD